MENVLNIKLRVQTSKSNNQANSIRVAWTKINYLLRVRSVLGNSYSTRLFLDLEEVASTEKHSWITMIA
jgi:hypothetical protein